MSHHPLSVGHEIVVSGSISNLGPGFDALSVAVNVFLRLRVVEIDPSRPNHLDMEFDGHAPSGDNRIATGFEQARRKFGDPTPGLRVKVSSDIPMKAGLGSSAAATVAGMRLYEAATSRRDPHDLLRIASIVEGHPDNAAAALHGGLTLSCQHDDGHITTMAWHWPTALQFVVATPSAELETAFARTVLPTELPLKDAVFNLQRALLLVRALETGEYGHLREALRDRWHQPARARFVPGLTNALAIDHPAVLGVCLSGAGPSIAAITRGRAAEATELLSGMYHRIGVPCTIRTLSAHQP